MIETGQILKIDDNEHFFFQPEGKLEKYYVGHDMNFGELEVGKTFTLKLTPRYNVEGIFKTPTGKYKLINFKLAAHSVCEGSNIVFLFFKDIKTNNILDTNNSGISLTIRLLPLKLASLNEFQSAHQNTGYQLLLIFQSSTPGNTPGYVFVNSSDPNDVFLVRFNNNINLSNRLGSFFTFIFSPYLLLTGITPTTDTRSYLLKQIYSSNIYVFSRNEENFYIDGKLFEISNSLVGKYFDILTIEQFSGQILDVEQTL